ncbi:MAG: ABC transporter ATP-binding protein [Chloroflexaceae bacterium]|nr:ABC transporter ATP-binding protein [Chloroflexaceae bacterium]
MSTGTATHAPAGQRSWADNINDIQTAMRNIPRALRLVWAAHRWSTLGMGGLTILAALLPVAQAWLGKLLVDTIVQALQAGRSPSEGVQALAPLLLVGFGLVTVGAAITQGYSLLEHMLNARLAHTINEQIIAKALALDLYYFEDAEFYNKLQNARREADYRALNIVNHLFVIMQGTITLLSFAALLLAISPLVALILFGATLPAFLAQAKYGGLYFRLLNARAPEFRQMHYLEYLLTVDSTVKEVKLFGLGLPLLRRYQDLFWRFYHEDAALARQRSLISVLWGTLSTA